MRRHIGRRGGVLIIFGLIYIAFGYIIYPTDPVRAQNFLYLFKPIEAQIWQWAWFTTGAIAIIQSFMKWDAIAFAALEFLGAVWAGGQYIALFFDNNYSAGTFAIVWTLCVVLLRIIDGWIEIPSKYLELETSLSE